MHLPHAFFRAVQLSGLYQDSKTFIDRPARYSYDDMESRWATFHRDWDGSTSSLRHFVEHVTSPEGSDLMQVVPDDWREKNESWLRDACLDDHLRQWALYLHRMWKQLCRVTRISPKEASQHSLLPLPRPFFIPGDRFREIYYWDSHWTVLGLIVSEMYDSAIDHIECLLALLERYGFVPNGGRHYYTNRSQPPLLSMTLRALYDESLHHAEEKTQKRMAAVVQRALPLLIREYRFWTSPPHGVSVKGPSSGKTHALSRYYAQTEDPRAESYREDLATLESMCDDEKRPAGALFRDIATAAESGHDFSSRWCSDPTRLDTIQTTRVLPVDLNAFLYALECNIAYFAVALDACDGPAIAESYDEAARRRQEAFDDLFWNAATYQWRDLLLCNEEDVAAGRDGYLANLVPLACGIAPPGQIAVTSMIHALRQSPLLSPGGCATSLVDSGQQWDGPNVWPPLQCLIVEGLMALEKTSPSCGAQELACEIAQRFLNNAYQGYQRHACMFEKYHCQNIGRPGYGGEYPTQMGFGWTNGAVLWLLRLRCRMDNKSLSLDP